ncbi:MAG: GNAT family N-acetyltransferase [Thermoplasmata archaeon]|nr:GNAT family N-acetyltransferase [Thermoplasmata archaeon]
MSAALLPRPDLSPPEIEAAIEDHLRTTFGGIRLVDDAIRGLPELNAVFSQAPESETLPTVIRRELSARSPPSWWWVGPSALHLPIPQTLLSFGFLLDHRRRGMAVNLGSAAQSTQPPSGTLFQEVREISETRHIADLWSRSGPLRNREGAFALNTLLAGRWSAPTSQVRFSLAWSNSRPVATVAIGTSGDVAGVFGLTTLPDARTRGIGRALLAFALRHAAHSGARWAVTTVRMDEERFYRNFGFAAYDDFEIYRATPLGIDSSALGV